MSCVTVRETHFSNIYANFSQVQIYVIEEANLSYSILNVRNLKLQYYSRCLRSKAYHNVLKLVFQVHFHNINY